MKTNLESTVRNIVNKSKEVLNEGDHLSPTDVKPAWTELGVAPTHPHDQLPDFAKEIKPGQAHLPTPFPTPRVGTIDGDGHVYTPNKEITEEENEDGNVIAEADDDDDKKKKKDDDDDDDKDDKVNESEDAVKDSENQCQYSKRTGGEPQPHVKGQKSNPNEYEKSPFDAPFDASKEDAAAQMTEDINDLFAGHKLSQSFIKKATALYEAAITMRTNAIVEAKEKLLAEAYDKKLDETKDELETKVQGYLDVVVENWVNENQVAIEHSLRTELAEEFLEGFKNLCLEHYIEIPDSKVDVLEQLSTKIDKLEESYSGAMTQIVELKKENKDLKKSAIITESFKNLSVAQQEKSRKLLEQVEFNDEETFTESVKMITESLEAKKAAGAKAPQILNEDAPLTNLDNEKSKTEVGGMIDQMRKRNLS